MPAPQSAGKVSELSVIHFERLRIEGRHSIERVFASIRAAFPAQYAIRVVGCPTPAHGRIKMVCALLRARRYRAQVLHIVGDVHYIALALRGNRTILTIHDLNHLFSLSGTRRVLYEWF